MSRTKHSIRNVRYSILSQMIIYIGNFVTRKIFLIFLTTEYLGLNGVFSNILSLLSLAELGFGTAISYSLYKPLAENDEKVLNSIMNLARRFYKIIGFSVFIIGASMSPFLKYIIGDLPEIPNIILIYLMFVMDSALSYFAIYKRDLIITDQKQYVTEIYQSVISLAKAIIQIITLVITRNYILFLTLQLFFTLLGNIMISAYANKLYPWINKRDHTKLDKEISSTIKINMKSVFLHRIGNTLVFSTDNILISNYFGVVWVGLYSNYYLIISALKTTYNKVFAATLASIGNLGVSSDKEHINMIFNRLNFLGGWLYGWSLICLIILFNPFVELWLGSEYLFSMPLVIIISINFYVNGMREAVRTFRSALGIYKYDRYKSVFEALINLFASIILAKKVGIVGIFIGTFLSTMLVCFWIEPYMLYKHGLKGNLKGYFKDYGLNTMITIIAYVLTSFANQLVKGSSITDFIARVLICIIVPNIIFAIFYRRRDEFKYYYYLLKGIIVSKVFKNGIFKN